ncbi:hypothetical protein [Streptococcus pneumoniae]|nr:hypothetical protein [Streptococcus pneumoniae]
MWIEAECFEVADRTDESQLKTLFEIVDEAECFEVADRTDESQ